MSIAESGICCTRQCRLAWQVVLNSEHVRIKSCLHAGMPHRLAEALGISDCKRAHLGILLTEHGTAPPTYSWSAC